MTLASLQTVTRNDEGIATALAVLAQRFGDRFQTGKAIREQHAHTTTYIPRQAPDGVVFAESEADVQETVRICAQYKVPVIPFGAGTSLEGHVNAPGGGVSIDMKGMNRIVEVHAEDLDCIVEPGVTRKQLNAYLRDTGLFFPIDPGADASLGGMASTRASGTNAVRYGTMKDNVLSLRAVMPNGEIIDTARRAKKSSAGYDLTRLLIGAEGTLGVITRLTLRLQGIPSSITAGVCPFPSVADACNAVIETIQCGVPVARIELVNAMQMKAMIAYSKLDYPESPALFLEFHGTDEGAKEQAEMFGEIAAAHGGTDFRWTGVEEERQKLWQARHDAYWAGFTLRPGAKVISTDVCVPISKLADCIAGTEEDIAASGLLAPIVGHVGDGNFHLGILLDVDNPAEVAAAERLVEQLNTRALAMEGTCTGEHGIGQGKMDFLEMELGPALPFMRAIKQALDPDNIMNPGKIFRVG